jgi:hypothetical protein
MHTLPNLSASRTPVHFATGCGAAHRNAPIGGAANGMPLNARMPVDDSVLPPSKPASSVNGSFSAACATPARPNAAIKTMPARPTAR